LISDQKRAWLIVVVKPGIQYVGALTNTVKISVDNRTLVIKC